MHVMNPSSNLLSNTNGNKVYLTREQIEKLKHVLDRSIPICSSPPSSSPTLNITPRHFLRQVLWKLKKHSIDIIDVRLNGGAASHVLVDDQNFVYRDIDILFLIRTPLSSEQKTNIFSSNNQSYSCDVWTLIKYIVCSCLLEHITNATSSEQPQQYTHHYLSSVLETYAKKIIKISSEQDSWALLSLQNFSGQNLELKFVEHLKRQWQFSVDSFQINLQPLLCEKLSHYSNRNSSHLCKCPSISSITKTIRTKSLVIDAINALTIIKKEHDDEMNVERISQDKTSVSVTSTSPLQFGFFTPSSSPIHSIEEQNHIECQTLATITTIATSNSSNGPLEARSRSSKSSISTINEESNSLSALQFHLSLNDDTDDGIVSDADDSANEDDDQVFRTPVDTNSAPPSPATIIAMDVSSSSSSSSSLSSLLIEVHSEYKDLKQAIEHLNKKQIATYAPETMRGGGLLKYCDLLAQNYKVHDATDMFRLQRYMCSRFFIDYKTIPEQIHVITQYITTHFLPLSISTSSPGNFSESSINRRNVHQTSNATNKSSSEQNHLMNARLCLLFFDHLLHVIQHSTVCLTHHDKELTLLSINQLKESYHYKYEYLFEGDHQHYQRYHVYPHMNHPHQHCSSSSSNSSRSSSPSSSSSNSYRYFRHHPNSHSNHRHQQTFQYRHHNHNHNHHSQRTTNHNSSYHPNSRNYSNEFNSNQTTPMAYHSRRHQT